MPETRSFADNKPLSNGTCRVCRKPCNFYLAPVASYPLKYSLIVSKEEKASLWAAIKP